MRTLGLLGSVTLPGKLRSVAIGRAYVAGLLEGTGRSDVDLIVLLISELLANAIQHSCSGRATGAGVVRLTVTDTLRALRVEVLDEGSAGNGPRIPEHMDPLAEGGRGLWLVREMSSACGWREHESGRIVWFEMAG